MAVGVREIANTGSRKVIGKFPSLKMKTSIWWESQIERDYIYLLEIDPNVLAYQGQPFHLNYTAQGKQHRYTPDFWVQRQNRNQVVEVKPASKVNLPKNIDLFRQINGVCLSEGMEFLVVTDTSIRRQPQLNNIKLLYKYARTPLTPQNYLDCENYFTKREPTTLAQTVIDLKGKGISQNILLKLLYWGYLETDLGEIITENSLLKKTEARQDALASLLN